MLSHASRQLRARTAAAAVPSFASGTARRATILAALVERSPQLTPEPSPLERAQLEHSLRLETLHKSYPSAMTVAEEGPDQQRARLHTEALIEREASREGEGDRTGDMRSRDRRLSQRLYLLVQRDGAWGFPQGAWEPRESARDGLRRAVVASCGEELDTHQMGNAPVGHLPLSSGDTLFLWRHLYVAGDVDAEAQREYVWVTKDELSDYLEPELLSFATVACGPFK
jgi:hypothetical protein